MIKATLLRAVEIAMDLKDITPDLERESFFGILEMILEVKVPYGNTGARDLIWQAYKTVTFK